MKRVVCLYGGPGVGKSTIAAKLFYLSKMAGLNVELVREYIKDWVWEGRNILPGDQIYIFAKQSRKERILFKDVDMIITDSPLWISAVYEERNEPPPMVIPLGIQKQLDVAAGFGFEYVHYYLSRVTDYNPSGRLQTADEAKKIDNQIQSYLDRHGIKYKMIVPGPNSAQEIFDDCSGG
jgi:adenylate kinase family enzyme